MLRSTQNVHEFNALFKHSRGLPTLLQQSSPPVRAGRKDWLPHHYSQAKTAIEPFGPGLGRDFLKHFLLGGSIPKNDTLQAAINAYYQEEWKKEGERLLEQSRLELWKGQEANDAAKIAAALELEKQAKVFLGKVKTEDASLPARC